MNSLNCPFCQIDTNRSPIIRQGEFFTSFLSNMRLMPGHVLVIPNRHVETPSDLTINELTAVYSEAQRLVGRMLDSKLAKGVDVWQKTRPDMAEGEIKVHHLHVHVLPSEPGDDLYDKQLQWTPDRFSPVAEEEARKMVALLS